MALYNQVKFGDLPDITGLLSPGRYGFIEGDIEGNGSYTFDQKKSMRQYNWKVLMNKMKIADLQSVNEVTMPDAIVEVYVPKYDEDPDAEYFEIHSDMLLKGTDDATTQIHYYPFIRQKANKLDIFKWGTNTKIRTTGIYHKRPGNGHKFETIDGVTTTDGVNFDVSAVPLMRAGLIAELNTRVVTNGETVNAYVIVEASHISNGKLGRDVKAQRVQVVSGSGSTLVLTALEDNWPSDGNIIPLSDYLNVDLTIALDFPEDISFADYNTYGDKWVHDDHDDILFRSTMNTTELVANGSWSEDHYTNSTFSGFQAVAKRYGDGATYADDITYFDCSQGGISCTSGDLPATNYSYWNQNGGTNIEIYNIGSIVRGTALHNYVTSGGIIGSSGYNGPGTQCRWTNVHVHDVESGTRQYSATSGSLAIAGAFSTFTDCTWIDCNEFGHYFSREMDITCTRVRMENSHAGNVSGTQIFDDCDLLNMSLKGDDQGQRSDLKNYPDLDAGDDYYPPTPSKKITCLVTNSRLTNVGIAFVKYGECKVLTIRVENSTVTYTDEGLNPINGGAYYSAPQFIEPAAVSYRVELDTVNFVTNWGSLYGPTVRRDVRVIYTDRLFELDITNCTINDLPINSPNISGFLRSGNTSVDGDWTISPASTYPQYQNIQPVITGSGNTKAAGFPWSWNQSGNPTSRATYGGQVPGSLET